MSHRISAGTFPRFLGVRQHPQLVPGGRELGQGCRAWHFRASLRPPVRTRSCSETHRLRHTKAPVFRNDFSTGKLNGDPDHQMPSQEPHLLMVSEIISLNSAWMTLSKPICSLTSISSSPSVCTKRNLSKSSLFNCHFKKWVMETLK